MDKGKVVFVVTVAGEQFIGENDYSSNEKFAYQAEHSAVALCNVRRLEVQHIPGQPNNLGQVPVRVVYELMNVDPFPGAVPHMRVRLSRWTFLGECDNPELSRNLDNMLDRAEKREAVMRATAAGLSVPGGKV